MKKIFYLDLLLLLFLFNCNSNEFKSNEYKINFNYSNDIVLKVKDNKPRILDKKFYEKMNGKYELDVYSKTYKSLREYLQTDYEIDKDFILKELNDNRSIFFNFQKKNKTFEILKKDNQVIGESQLFIDNSFFIAQSNYEKDCRYLAYIIKNNFVIIIRLSFYDGDLTLTKKYPQYFDKDPDGNPIWKDQKTLDNMYDMIIKGSDKAPIELVKLYKYFQEIKNSLKIEE